jgi:hypothetical protein
MKTKPVLIAVNFLIVAVLACNMQSPVGGNSPDLAATITAQALLLAGPSGTPASSSNAPSTPEASVTSVTNCRTGPSTAYDLVFTVKPGQSLQLVGKDSADNYWIVKNPVGGTCWLWGQYAVTAGDTNSLPEYPPPPVPTAKSTKTPKPKPTATATTASGSGLTKLPPIVILTLVLKAPAGPTGLAQSRTCGGAFAGDGITPIWEEALTLTWQDQSTNESGYHIYKNNAQVSSIPADSTSYHITLRYNQGTGGPLYDTFGVEAFNIGGASARAAMDVPRCP